MVFSSKILSVQEVAEILGITDLEVKQLVRDRKLNPCKSHLRNIRFSEAEISAYKVRLVTPAENYSAK